MYWSAGAAPTRAETIARLAKYLGISEGDDPDRIEGARGTMRLYTALGERQVWIPKSRPARLELPLYPLPGVAGRNRGYLVEAVLGEGKRTRLLLDTGSGGLFLLERIARRGGLVPLSEETVFGGGGGGRQTTRRGLLPAIALGDLRFADALVSTTTDEIEPTGRYHGVLGLPVFEGYRVTLDLERSRLVLEPPAEEPGGSPYWSIAGQMLVRVEAGEGAGGLFMLDTGATSSQVSLTLAKSAPKASLGAEIPVRGFGGTMPGARPVRGIALAFQGLASEGRELIAADLTMRSRLGGVEVSGQLGLDLLDGTRVVVDTKAHRIEVTRGTKTKK
ncbi:MAG: aspartyl protease family protein [Acidobacteriia bacterium]|nr:aspartyl protease family protein [Terriglobia bacterium]